MGSVSIIYDTSFGVSSFWPGAVFREGKTAYIYHRRTRRIDEASYTWLLILAVSHCRNEEASYVKGGRTG
ncbi:hypothetical protein Lal_00029133 [Lupinus albus]|nr:hypothetical protein Lal_00029133 [Lupinus albus]